MPGLAIIFGFLAASAALLTQVLLSIFVTTPLTTPLTGAPSLVILIGAAAIEEGAKLALLFQFGRRSRAPVSFLSAFLFGIGFVAAELGLLTLSTSALPGFLTIGALALVHIVGTLIIYSGLRFRSAFALSTLFGLLTAILIHTLYNSSL